MVSAYCTKGYKVQPGWVRIVLIEPVKLLVRRFFWYNGKWHQSSGTRPVERTSLWSTWIDQLPDLFERGYLKGSPWNLYPKTNFLNGLAAKGDR